MRELISNILQNAIKEEFNIDLEKEKIISLLESPPSTDMGDLAFPCFILAKEVKGNPSDIALKLREAIGSEPATEFDDIQTAGPYVNFFVNRKAFALDLISKVKKQGDKFGSSNIGNKKTIVLDMSSPNIAKPFGIGHLRSTIIGNSISNIANFSGYKTVKINYLGDWGTQFGKLIVGFTKWGNQEELKKDPINHLLKLYVKANDKKYEQDARDEFKKLEQGDKTNLELWKTFRELSLTEFNKIYEFFNIKFDIMSGESFYNNKMQPIIEELKQKKLLKESEGAQIVDLKKYNLGVCLIQKSDGTSLYATRDITAAIERYNKYKFDQMIYEVGSEQHFQFQQFFKVLELMGYEWAKNCVHVEHGLYLDENGKKFATRKGKTIFMEDIIKETLELAKKEIKSREPKISNKELESRAKKVAIASIFYGDLKNNRKNDMVFDISKFVSFEGNTGPYLLYSYARASSILNKIKKQPRAKALKELDEKEYNLINKVRQFPEIVTKSYLQLNPSLIANYSYELAQIFNEFYQQCPVIGSENEKFRIDLVDAFRQTLKNSLGLLGIDTLDKM